MTPDINFESLSYNPFGIHESSINSEHDPDILTFTKIFLLLRHITVPLMVLRTIFKVSRKISFPFYIQTLEA